MLVKALQFFLNASVVQETETNTSLASAQTVPNLSQLTQGHKAIVTKLNCQDSELREKLMTMGIVGGTEVELANIAAFGGPLQIKARGYYLSLRRNEAQAVEIRPL